MMNTHMVGKACVLLDRAFSEHVFSAVKRLFNTVLHSFFYILLMQLLALGSLIKGSVTPGSRPATRTVDLVVFIFLTCRDGLRFECLIFDK